MATTSAQALASLVSELGSEDEARAVGAENIDGEAFKLLDGTERSRIGLSLGTYLKVKNRLEWGGKNPASVSGASSALELPAHGGETQGPSKAQKKPRSRLQEVLQSQGYGDLHKACKIDTGTRLGQSPSEVQFRRYIKCVGNNLEAYGYGRSKADALDDACSKLLDQMDVNGDTDSDGRFSASHRNARAWFGGRILSSCVFETLHESFEQGLFTTSEGLHDKFDNIMDHDHLRKFVHITGRPSFGPSADAKAVEEHIYDQWLNCDRSYEKLRQYLKSSGIININCSLSGGGQEGKQSHRILKQSASHLGNSE